MNSVPRRIRPYVSGAALVFVGFALAKLPTWLVASGRVSLFDIVKKEAVILHVTGGCEGSAWAVKSYQTDPALRAVSIPATRRSTGYTSFSELVCTLALDALMERNHWWVRLVDRDVACKSLWDGERRFLETHKLLGWPQFSDGDTMIMSFDDGALRHIGVEKVLLDDRKVYRGLSQ